MPERLHLIDIQTRARLGLSDAVLEKLVQMRRLPKDILFRSCAAFTDDLEEHDALKQAVFAALDPEHEAMPTFVQEPLPDCALIPTWDRGELRKILIEVDDDYHRLYDLQTVMHSYGLGGERSDDVARKVWSILVRTVSSTVSRRISGEHPRDRAWALSRTVIRDEPLFSIYQERHTERRIKGLGTTTFQAMRFLLADNHPELYEDRI